MEKKVPVGNTYWGASPSEVRESETSGNWEHVGQSKGNQDNQDYLIEKYKGSLFDFNCEKRYVFDGNDGLYIITYIFVNCKSEEDKSRLFNFLKLKLTEFYGEPKRGYSYPTWFTNDLQTFIDLSKRFGGISDSKIGVLMEYNGADSENRQVPYDMQFSEEFGSGSE